MCVVLVMVAMGKAIDKVLSQPPRPSLPSPVMRHLPRQPPPLCHDSDSLGRATSGANSDGREFAVCGGGCLGGGCLGKVGYYDRTGRFKFSQSQMTNCPTTPAGYAY